MYKKTLLFLLIISISLLATQQTHDIVTVHGKTFGVEENLLPKKVIKKLDALYPKRKRTTSNWLGYSATWKITDNTLSLVDITIPKVVSKTSVVDTSIIDQLSDYTSSLALEGYSGKLHIPYGIVDDLDLAIDAFIVLKIKKGIIISVSHKATEAAIEKELEKYPEFQKTSTFKELQTSYRSIVEKEKQVESLLLLYYYLSYDKSEPIEKLKL